MKRYHSHQGRDIFVTAGSARELPPGSFGICAIGGGAEGWAVVHIGPEGDAADLGGEYCWIDRIERRWLGVACPQK